MNGLETLPLLHNYFHNPGAPLLGAMNAMNPIGNILSFAGTAYLSDRFGRRICVVIGLLLIYIGAAIQGASVNVGMFLFARFILGVATSFVSQPSPMLVTELAYPTHR